MDALISGGVAPERIRVIESCTNGSFSRLIFNMSGLTKFIKRKGAKVIFLDERPTMPVLMGNPEYAVPLPDVIVDDLIHNRDRHNYISLALLKTHNACVMTGTVKNQQGCLPDKGKRILHNYYLHEKLADVYQTFRPDFGIIDGDYAMAHGPVLPQNKFDKFLFKTNVILGGPDCVAVDAVASRILGYDPGEVKHLTYCADRGLGIIQLDDIDIVGDVSRFTQTLPWKQYTDDLPESVTFVKGKERACIEGCFGMAENITYTISQDYGIKRPFTIVVGKGIPPESLDNLTEPILVAGVCATNECYAILKQKYRKVKAAPECGCIGSVAKAVIKMAGADSPANLPYPFIKAIRDYLLARLHRVNSIFTDPFRPNLGNDKGFR